MLLSAVSVLVVAQSSSEIPEGLMNNSVYQHTALHAMSALKQGFTLLLLHHMQSSSLVIQLIPSIFF